MKEFEIKFYREGYDALAEMTRAELFPSNTAHLPPSELDSSPSFLLR